MKAYATPTLSQPGREVEGSPREGVLPPGRDEISRGSLGQERGQGDLEQSMWWERA